MTDLEVEIKRILPRGWRATTACKPHTGQQIMMVSGACYDARARAQPEMEPDSFVEFVEDQLSGLPDIRSRAMFGGYGLYQGDVFFAIIFDGRLYFKTNAQTAQHYVEAGMKSFEPRPGQGLKNYYEVPVDVIEDDSKLVAWARAAIQSG